MCIEVKEGIIFITSQKASERRQSREYFAQVIYFNLHMILIGLICRPQQISLKKVAPRGNLIFNLNQLPDSAQLFNRTQILMMLKECWWYTLNILFLVVWYKVPTNLKGSL